MRTYRASTSKLVNGNWEACEQDDPDAVWGIYSYDENGISRWVADALSKDLALRILDVLRDAESEMGEAIKGKRSLRSTK